MLEVLRQVINVCKLFSSLLFVVGALPGFGFFIGLGSGLGLHWIRQLIYISIAYIIYAVRVQAFTAFEN